MTNHNLLPTDERFDQIKERLLDVVAADDRRRTRKHRLIAIGVAGAIVAGTTGAAIAIALASQGRINYETDCYAAADLGSRHGSSVPVTADLGEKTPTPLSERIRNAEDVCAATWRIGTFSPEGSSSTAEYPVPHLETCQLPDGRLAVFPSDQALSELCSRLGLTIPHE
ncbi:MAG: hypothetical protein ACTHJI_13270 [Leifsonia sp.]|jgi:hypothetical protein